MASGDLTVSAPVVVDMNDLQSTVAALTLSIATDRVHIVPCNLGKFVVFKSEREA